MLSRQGFFRECLFKKLLTTRSFWKIPKNSEPHESQFKVFFRLRRKDVNSGFSGTKGIHLIIITLDHTTKRIMFKEHQARNQSFRVITKTLLFSSLILGGSKIFTYTMIKTFHLSTSLIKYLLNILWIWNLNSWQINKIQDIILL